MTEPPSVVNHTPGMVVVNPDPIPSLPPVEFTTTLIVKLAREIVVEFREVKDILARFRLTQEQYDAIQKIPFYQQAVKTFAVEWNEVKSTEERLRMQALTILEDSLVGLGARMNDQQESLSAVTEAAKLFARLGGVGEKAQAGAIGDKFSITINLGDDKTVQITKDVTPAEEARGVSAALPENGEGHSRGETLSAFARDQEKSTPVLAIPEREDGSAPLRILP